MNEIILSLFKRKSVRQFQERPVSPEEKALILESALQAPTAGNQNLYTILEQEEKVREALGLDEYVFPAAFVVYGFPTKGQMERVKPGRPPLSYIVQENRYRTKPY